MVTLDGVARFNPNLDYLPGEFAAMYIDIQEFISACSTLRIYVKCVVSYHNLPFFY